MTDIKPGANPVAVAEESGLVYANSSSEKKNAYLLLQLKEDPEDAESLHIDLTTEGLNEDSILPILESFVEKLRAEKA